MARHDGRVPRGVHVYTTCLIDFDPAFRPFGCVFGRVTLSGFLQEWLELTSDMQLRKIIVSVGELFRFLTLIKPLLPNRPAYKGQLFFTR